MRYRLDFIPPADPTFFVRYGWDPLAGFGGELRTLGWERPIVEYSALQDGYRHDFALRGLLEWMIEVGALNGTSVDEALVASASASTGRLSKDCRRAIRVIRTLMRESD